MKFEDINNFVVKKLNLNLKIVKFVSFLLEFKISYRCLKQVFKINYVILRSKKNNLD